MSFKDYSWHCRSATATTSNVAMYFYIGYVFVYDIVSIRLYCHVLNFKFIALLNAVFYQAQVFHH